MAASQLIDLEHHRLVASGGFSTDRDSQNHPYAIFVAASAYANAEDEKSPPPLSWPWSVDEWRPGSREQNLVMAGGLCLVAADIAKRKQLPAVEITEYRFFANRLAAAIDRQNSPSGFDHPADGSCTALVPNQGKTRIRERENPRGILEFLRDSWRRITSF